MSSWMFDEEREAFGRLVLLELLDQALREENRLGEVSYLTLNQEGRPSGRPPAGACLVTVENPLRVRDLLRDRRQRDRLCELFKLLNKETKNQLEPAEERRVAEIAEAFGDLKAAYGWWRRAAASGDEDAKDYVEILEEELGVSDVPDDAATSRRLFREHFTVPQVRLLRRFCSREQIAEAELNDLFGEIEQFLSNPDQVADGGRRI
ncbi:hypothetical protein ACIBLA_25915 [Streptomyces sp. NPDC050433]|uniref:hypothetical protein n=1 Tax=unclassified Streptomyces TaxID=2593676 RepID=UPI0034134D4F